jgi:hypothetical protein
MKRQRIATVYIVLFFASLPVFSQPSLSLYDLSTLRQVQQAYREKDPAFRDIVKKLERDADKVLDLDPPSVTEKELTAPSGNTHDYTSMSRYWWPNPDTKDGLPYIRRDGETNPEVKKYEDHEKLERMAKGVTTLSLAYYFSGKEKYAEKAVEFIRVWFIDTTTMMNPNMKYAQFVKGRNEGKGGGILDAREFSMMLDMLGILKTSASWTAADHASLQSWFEQYLDWLRTSKNGTDEMNAKNNHGTWYDVQTISIALFLGKTDLAKQIASEAKVKRIDNGFLPSGEQPEELARTRSLHYSLFNLEALMRLARFGTAAGVNLWQYKGAQGAGIRRGVDYLLPFVAGEQEWSHEQIDPVSDQLKFLILAQAYTVYGDDRYLRAASALSGLDRRKERNIALYGIRLP